MNYSTAVFLINNNVHAIECSYEEIGVPAKASGLRIFKTLDHSIAVGDFVIVPTHTRHNMTVVKVTKLDANVDFDGNTQIDWIVGKVDRTEYEQILAMEVDAIEKIKSAEIRSKREALAKALWADKTEELKAIPLSTAGDMPIEVKDTL